MNVRLSIGLITLGILASLSGAFIFLDSYNQKEKEHYFNSKAHDLSLKIELSIERKGNTLRGLEGFFHASSFVDKDEWKTFEVNSASLTEGESTGYILFNTSASAEAYKKYGQDPSKQAPIVYSGNSKLVSVDTKGAFVGLAPGTIIKAPEIFNDNRSIIVWPHKKGNEAGCFFLSYFEEEFSSIAALENLNCSIVKDTPNLQGLSFQYPVNLGEKEYVLLITPSESFDSKVDSLPYFATVSFIGVFILLLIIRIQSLNKDKDRKLAEQLVHENNILEALNVGTAKYSGDKFFDKLALNLGEVFDSDYCFVTEIANKKELQTLSAYMKREKIDNMCYLKAGTPCEKAVTGELVYHEGDIQTIYPDDAFFRETDMNSYLGAPIMSSEGKVLGLLVILKKTTIKYNDHLELVLKIFAERCSVEIQQKNSYEALLKSKEDLEEARNKAIRASKSKSEFLAVMSHEIRTPLNGIVGSLNLLKETGDLSTEQQDFVDTINFSSESLMQIINDILDFSKIEAGKMTLESIPFSLKKIMDSVKCIFIPIADEKGLEFLAPEPSNIGNYKGDPGRIRQVIINLVNNALKFTKEGSVVVMTTISQEDGKAKIKIAVEDTGIGISEENQAKIFESFSQEDSSTTRKFGGTGLGLSISKRLAKMMGGDLKVESVLGEGATFTAELILEIADEDINLAVQSAEVISSFHGRVLLVEDNAVNKKIATKILQKMHLEVETADNGQEALDMCHEHSYDLIFMDVMMPVMDGLEATSKLRDEGNKTPIVAMTANAFEEDKRKCLSAGMDGFLSKPLKKNEIIFELDRFLDAG